MTRVLEVHDLEKNFGGVVAAHDITVNVDDKGRVSTQGGQSTSAGGEASSDRDGKAFARQLESAVLKVISDQKRQGGMLYGATKK